MRAFHRRLFVQTFIAVVLLVLIPCGDGELMSAKAENPFHHLVILGDPHLPGRNVERKEKMLAKINSWNDVEMVVAVGDICAEFGTDAEYAAAGKFFGKLRKPFFPITGNHDFYYKSPPDKEGKLVEGTKESQQVKLGQFCKTFGLSKHYYSRRAGQYLLVFLSADHSDHMAGISDRQLVWLRRELSTHRKIPTLIFFHAPLKGTLRDYRRFINTSGFVAQPEAAIHDILTGNPQVFLWVSGHTHTSPLEESYASPINLYAGRVINIHNKDMNRETIWTNSLYLYPHKVMIRTYSHEENTWLPRFDRTVLAPEL